MIVELKHNNIILSTAVTTVPLRDHPKRVFQQYRQIKYGHSRLIFFFAIYNVDSLFRHMKKLIRYDLNNIQWYYSYNLSGLNNL